jgi:DNA polymerase III alpha subunit
MYNLNCTKKRRVGLSRPPLVKIQELQEPIVKVQHRLISHFIRPCPPEYQARLEEELELIEMNEFEPIFEQVIEILQHYKRLWPDHPHIIRGSAASSLVSYLLGITDIDPVHHNMCFSRFMNKKRKNKPDIDIDFPQHVRDVFMQQLFDMPQYQGRIARISNHVNWTKKSLQHRPIRFSGKYLSLKDIDEEGLFHHYSTHCGGIVIAEQPFPPDHLLKPGQLKFNKEQTETAGYMKVDLLSNRGLSILQGIQQLLGTTRSIVEYATLDQDGRVAQLLSSGDTIGITFCETPAMIHICKLVQPKTPEQLAFCLAMVRPAADTNLIRKMIESHFDYDLEACRKKDLYSMMVYDDDVVQYMQAEFGLNETDAECLRKRCQKKDSVAYEEIVQKSSKEVADRMFEVASKYSFCKSHAMSYGYLSWALAYHKVHYPVEFWCSVLNYAFSMYPRWVYVRQAIAQTGYHVQEQMFDRIELWKIDYKLKYYYKTNTLKQQKLIERRLSEVEILELIRRYGYWTEDEFVPDCFFIDEVRYRGVVCATREYQGYQFVSLMISNAEIKHVIVYDANKEKVQLNRVFSHF